MTQLAAGQRHALALVGGGGLYAWGRNWNGQLGDGTTTQRLSPVPITGVSTVRSVAAGLSHSLAVTETGVYAWGLNSSAQVGDGTTTQRTVPTLVPRLPSIAQVAVLQH